MVNDKPVLGNVYDKYSTQNPVAKFLFQNFLQTVEELVQGIAADSVLEVGCGEGHLSQLLKNWLRPSRICAVDLVPDLFASRHRQTSVDFLCQSAYQLGFRETSFDLVVGAEVLEHLEDPRKALKEIQRVAGRYVLLSVPREPLWRAMNLARFAYWCHLGNTPGHLQHWSSAGFLNLVSACFEVLEVRKPLPWTVLLAVKKEFGS